jgi:arabinofuranosyltransferase
MSGDGQRKERAAEYVLFAAVLFCVACSFFMMDYLPDDSFISFRYAENLANGHGLRFNVNEPPVEGYSNLLWILFCTLLYKIGLVLPDVVPTAGVLLSIFNILLLWSLCRRRGLPSLQMLLPLLVLAGSGPVVMYAVSGMETPLYAFFLLLMLYLLEIALSGGKAVHYALLAASGFLLSLCRPEGVAAFPVMALAVLFLKIRGKEGAVAPRAKRNLVLSVAAFAVASIAYHAWRVDYFGEWWSTPLLSKGGGGVSLLSAWIENLTFYFVKHQYYMPPVGYYYAALAIVAFVGFAMSPSTGEKKRAEMVALALFVFYAAVYFNFNDWMPGMRYYAPYVAILMLPAVHVQRPYFAASTAGPGRRSAPFWLAGLAVIVLNLGVLAEMRVIAHITQESTAKCSVALGKWLKTNIPSDRLLAVSDVGAIPYYSGLATLDIHPQSLTDIRIAKNGFNIDYIAGRDPAVIIIPSRSFAVARFYPEHFEMASDIRFDNYRMLGVSRYDWFEDRCYWVYVKKDFPLFTDEQMSSFPNGLGSLQRMYH